MKPKVIVLSGYGLNCEEETKLAFKISGGSADIVHINDLIAGKYKLSDYQIMAIGGGFAYADDTGAGNAYANKMRNHLWKDIEKFVTSDKLVIGICNGFQILCEIGLLPGVLTKNKSLSFICDEVYLKVVNNQTPFTKLYKEGEIIKLPIAHGDGRYIPKDINNSQIVFQYCDKKGNITEETNPNGSINNIAGIHASNILGMMPHPERFCESILGSEDGKRLFESIIVNSPFITM